MRVIIAGSRDFNDYFLLQRKLDELLPPSAVVVSGGARGADSLGERYASERGLWMEKMPADWNAYGKYAGIERNKRMAEKADWLVAFNAGTPGTTNMVSEMRKLGKKVVEVKLVRRGDKWIEVKEGLSDV